MMASANILNVEGFDPAEWKIGRKGREWRGEEFMKRLNQAPEKIEYKGGIFIYESERLTVLAMLLENLGIDNAVQLGNLEDWKAAIADFEQQRNESQIKGG